MGFQNDVWKKKGLKVLYFIARFVLALLFSIKKTKLKKVDRKIFSIIGDDSSEYEFYRARKLVKEKPTILDRL